MNSLRLIVLALLLVSTIGLLAADTPPFSDNQAPIFENTYLIDNIGNNSRGADLTLRVHKNAPFGNCDSRIDCPASVIVSGATGNVNMPVDVNVRSLFIGKNAVIDPTGKWVGSSTGLIGPTGPQGPKGDTGPAGPQGQQGFQGPKGDTGAVGPTGPQGLQGFQGPKGDTGAIGPTGPQGFQGQQGLKGDTGAAGPGGPQGPKGDSGAAGPQGPKGENGEGCWYDDRTGRINCAGGTWIEISSLKGAAGSAGATGPQGPKGDSGAVGPQGPKGEQGDGCWFDDRSGRINCAGGTWIEISSLQGPQGDTGAAGLPGPQGPKGDTGGAGPQGPKGDSGRWNPGTCREVSSFLEQNSLPQMNISSECAADEFLLTGYCNISTAGQLRSWAPEFSRGRFSCSGWRNSGIPPLWGDLQSTAVCCKK